MHTFYIVDVFAEKKYAGNQLAVFRHGRDFSTEEMQAIAREMNFSETTFIDSDAMRDGGFDVRIFTPAAELPFAGHPTLGTAFVIKEFILQKNVERITLNLPVGKIPVTMVYDGERLDFLWMKQINPSFGRTLAVTEVAAILNLRENDLDASFPIQEVSTGIPFFMVPLKSLKAVQNITVNHEKYYNLVYRINPQLKKDEHAASAASGFMVFSTQVCAKGHDLHARMFDDYFGVPEDPATGSANGCLLAYLLKHHYFKKSELDLRVEQGYEIKRPSLIRIKGRVINEHEMEIFVGGKVQMVARGEWF